MPSTTYPREPRRPLHLIVVGLAVAGSAVLWFFAVGLRPFWPAAWLAPIPVLWVGFRSSRRMAFGAAALAWLLGSTTLIPYLLMVMPPVPVAIVTILRALVCGGAVLAAHMAARRFHPSLSVFAFPAAWVAFEFLISFAKDGTSLGMAYSQMDFLPVLQVASATGIWGVTFVVLLAPSGIVLALARKSFAPIVPAIAIIVVVLSFGYARLQSPRGTPVVSVGLVATDDGIERAFRTQDTNVALITAREYAERIRTVASHGAQVVVLPEKFLGLTPADSEQVRNIFCRAARASQVTVVAGFNLIGIQSPRNVATVFAPDGREILEYDKRHMLEGPETGYLVGLTPGLFDAPGAPWGTAICKDMDFPSWSREYARRGVRILAVPAWDFGVDAKLHARMAHLRSIENGFTLVRVAQEGLVSVSDAWGRVLVEEPSAKNPAMAVIGVPAGPGATFYTHSGDWLGWISVATLAGTLVFSWPRRATLSS